MLAAGGIRIDQELVALDRAAGIITLAVDVIDIITVPVLIIGAPGNNKTTVRKAGYIRKLFFVPNIGVAAIDQDLAPDGRAAGIIELAEDIIAGAAA